VTDTARLEQARRLCREIGGAEVDRFAVPAAVIDRVDRTGRPMAEVVRDVVSGFWVRRDRAGDPVARSRLAGMWAPDVLRWCRWSAPRGVDPEEAAQEVLTRAMAALGRLPDPEAFRPWVWGITWRVLREQERGPWLRRWTFGLLDKPSAEPPSEEPGADGRIEHAERLAAVQAVLGALTLEERTLLWHAYVDGCTRAEIAERTGLSVGTLNRRLTHARERFGKEATRRGLAPIPRLAAEGAGD
jgi:RNA polymerase sigma factor (sigma-70 family)